MHCMTVHTLALCLCKFASDAMLPSPHYSLFVLTCCSHHTFRSYIEASYFHFHLITPFRIPLFSPSLIPTKGCSATQTQRQSMEDGFPQALDHNEVVDRDYKVDEPVKKSEPRVVMPKCHPEEFEEYTDMIMARMEDECLAIPLTEEDFDFTVNAHSHLPVMFYKYGCEDLVEEYQAAAYV
ncbi:uncharacterized protein LOC130748131 [Lotus japonicus]|uniref:uncharacterized protein LOC130748131 n=1 Tax=Lotus japonicus TaxID=34305 RepID=UPI00258F6A90|nr:uncharacterized protein LOC130748131 [Lotus japonicus]